MSDTRAEEYEKLTNIFNKAVKNFDKTNMNEPYAEPFYKLKDGAYKKLKNPLAYACNLLIYGKDSVIANLFSSSEEIINAWKNSTDKKSSKIVSARPYNFNECFTQSDRKCDYNPQEYMDGPSPLRVFNLVTLILGKGYYNQNRSRFDYIMKNREKWLQNTKYGIEKLVNDTLAHLKNLYDDNEVPQDNKHKTYKFICNKFELLPSCLLSDKANSTLYQFIQIRDSCVKGGRKMKSPAKKPASKRKSPAKKTAAPKKK